MRLSLSTSTQRSMQQSEWVVFFSLSLPDRNLETSMRIHFHRILYLTLGDTPKIQYPKEVGVRVRSYGETCCMNQQKPKTKIKMKDAKKHKAIYCMTCPIGCRNSERIWSMNVVRQSYAETLSLDIETLPVLLMNCQWSREQKWNRVRVSMLCTRTFRRTQIAISAGRRK